MTQKLPEECRTSGGYRSIARFAMVLWVVLFSVVFAVVAGSFLGSAGGAPGIDDAHAADETGVREQGPIGRGHDAPDADRAEGIVERYFPGVDFSFDLDRGTGLDFGLSTDSIDVRFAGLGGDDGHQTGTINHGAIDEGVARSSNAGLCAVGLTGPDAPVSLDVDGKSGSVGADLVSDPVEREPTNGSESAAAAVQSCTSGGSEPE